MCLTDFTDWRYIHSWLVFSTQLVNCCPMDEGAILVYCCPSTFSLTSPPSQSVAVGGMLNYVVDHILQEFYTLFLTRFGWVRRIPHLLMHLFLDEGFKHRLHSPQLSAVQLTQLGLPQTRPLLQCKGAVFRIHDILGWIRIRILGSMLPTGGSGSGFWIQMLLFSSLTFQMPAKK
jgi:hypothetical protein